MAEPRKSLEPFLRDSVEYYKHQVTGVRQMVPMESCLLADDMGLGKSLQALTVFCVDVKLGKGDTLLIVCPVSLRENWADEIEKFTRLPFTLLGQVADPKRPGALKTIGPKAREAQLLEFMGRTGPRILIVNYEQIAPHQGVFNKFRFHMGIFDEAHMIKNHKAKRTQAALELRSQRSLMLTGTPMLNQVDELWTILHRIDPRKFPKYWTFVNRYCVFGGYENRQVIGVKNEAELKKLLGQVMIRRLKKNVLSRDEPTYIRHMVGLSAVQRKLYDQIEDELFLEDPSTGEPLDVENALTKFLRLKQICNTPYSINPSFPDDSLKMDRVIEVTQELADENKKFILFSQFRGTIEATVNRLYRGKIGPVFQLHGDVPKNMRQATVAEWGNVSGSSIIVCQTAVAGVGLNMVQASNVGFIDKLFVPGLNKQAVDRADRIGQTEPVMVHEFLTRGTVEPRIEAILKAKGDLGEEIIGGSMGIRKLLEMLKQRMTEE